MEVITIENLFMIFFVAIVVDFLTGILVAAKNGKLKSRTCSNGMFRSIGECIVLTIFIFVSTYIPSMHLLFSTFIVGFIFKEGLSITENLIGLDVWIPSSIKRMLEVGVNRVDSYDKEVK
ncbi:MAG: phage holin family protein [Cetobacterium sp.]